MNRKKYDFWHKVLLFTEDFRKKNRKEKGRKKILSSCFTGKKRKEKKPGRKEKKVLQDPVSSPSFFSHSRKKNPVFSGKKEKYPETTVWGSAGKKRGKWKEYGSKWGMKKDQYTEGVPGRKLEIAGEKIFTAPEIFSRNVEKAVCIHEELFREKKKETFGQRDTEEKIFSLIREYMKENMPADSI